MYTVTADNGTNRAQKNYTNLEVARNVVARLLRLKALEQAYFNGVTVLNYISIDHTDVNENGEVIGVFEYLDYVCGDKLRLKVLGY